MKVHYLEIVASDVDAVCAAYRLHTASSLDQLIRFLEVRGRLLCRMGAALACVVRCGIRRSPSFDRTGSLATSKQRWMRYPRRALSLRTLRRRFQERARLRSTSREMWITGCGNYDFWPTTAPADGPGPAFCGG
jgi:hypothetical protein